MSLQIASAYRVHDFIVVAIHSSVPMAQWSRKKYCMSVFQLPSVENFVGDLRISDDRQEIGFQESELVVSVDHLIDRMKAQLFFWHWRAVDARSFADRNELVGCWRNAGGYALLQASGEYRQKLVGKGTACDLSGEWRWEYRTPSEFQMHRCADHTGMPTVDPSATFHIVQFDGQSLILSGSSKVLLDPGEILIQDATIWQKAKKPKSWSSLI